MLFLTSSTRKIALDQKGCLFYEKRFLSHGFPLWRYKSLCFSLEIDLKFYKLHFSLTSARDGALCYPPRPVLVTENLTNIRADQSRITPVGPVVQGQDLFHQQRQHLISTFGAMWEGQVIRTTVMVKGFLLVDDAWYDQYQYLLLYCNWHISRQLRGQMFPSRSKTNLATTKKKCCLQRCFIWPP